MKLKIRDIAYHRNGVSGEGFHVVTFDSYDHSQMIAVLFNEPGHCAVFNQAKLGQGDIKFGSNSFRGDAFEFDLRQAIVQWQAMPLDQWISIQASYSRPVDSKPFP